jgi:anti-sigma regulatory factor (Ser/Thr protein kinase)
MHQFAQPSREFLAKPTEVGLARSWVIDGLKANPKITPHRLIDIEIALGEVLQNIVRHQFASGALPGTFKIHWKLEPDTCLSIQIFDNGASLTDLGFLTKVHEKSDKGGFGIYLINKLVDSYQISTSDNGNFHYLVFKNA